jgi:hypothetical protein
MPRTNATTKKSASKKQVSEDSGSQKEETTIEVVDYSKMTATALKKLLDERKIDGRSKLTKKEAMMKVLELFDQNPEDKSAIAALVAEISTPRKRNATKSEVEPEETTEDKKEEESKMNVEKPKKKSKSKKETSSESEEPVKEESHNNKEKPKKKSKAKKETSSESEEGDKEKPKRKGKSKKETSEDSKKNAKTKTNKKKEEETPVESTISSTSDVLLNSSDALRLISDKEPSPSIIDMVDRIEDSQATQKIEDNEATQKIEETSALKKRGRKLPGAVKVLPEIYVNEEKKEVSDDSGTQMEATPTAHQPEMVDPEDDPAMIEVFKLTRDILRQMKYLAREAHRDDNFKKSWTKQLSNMKKDFEHQLGMLGATVDEE